MRRSGFAEKLLSVLLALCLWQGAGMLMGQSLLLVTPVQVALRLFSVIGEDGFLSTVWFSFIRIVGGFFLAFLLGAALGVAAGRFSLIESLLWPYLVTIKAVPVVSFIILALIFLSARELNVFISFLMVLPIVYTNILSGIRATDGKLTEMARLFRVPWTRKLLHVYLPQLRPYIMSACSVSLGLSWKAGIAAEVIGIPAGSIGERMYEAKIYLSMADLACWTAIMVLVSLLFEKGFLHSMKRAFDALESI